MKITVYKLACNPAVWQSLATSSYLWTLSRWGAWLGIRKWTHACDLTFHARVLVHAGAYSSDKTVWKTCKHPCNVYTVQIMR